MVEQNVLSTMPRREFLRRILALGGSSSLVGIPVLNWFFNPSTAVAAPAAARTPSASKLILGAVKEFGDPKLATARWRIPQGMSQDTFNMHVQAMYALRQAPVAYTLDSLPAQSTYSHYMGVAESVWMSTPEGNKGIRFRVGTEGGPRVLLMWNCAQTAFWGSPQDPVIPLTYASGISSSLKEGVSKYEPDYSTYTCSALSPFDGTSLMTMENNFNLFNTTTNRYYRGTRFAVKSGDGTQWVVDCSNQEVCID